MGLHYQKCKLIWENDEYATPPKALAYYLEMKCFFIN